jgi:hypothetical protein
MTRERYNTVCGFVYFFSIFLCQTCYYLSFNYFNCTISIDMNDIVFLITIENNNATFCLKLKLFLTQQTELAKFLCFNIFGFYILYEQEAT